MHPEVQCLRRHGSEAKVLKDFPFGGHPAVDPPETNPTSLRFQESTRPSFCKKVTWGFAMLRIPLCIKSLVVHFPGNLGVPGPLSHCVTKSRSHGITKSLSHCDTNSLSH